MAGTPNPQGLGQAPKNGLLVVAAVGSRPTGLDQPCLAVCLGWPSLSRSCAGTGGTLPQPTMPWLPWLSHVAAPSAEGASSSGYTCNHTCNCHKPLSICNNGHVIAATAWHTMHYTSVLTQAPSCAGQRASGSHRIVMRRAAQRPAPWSVAPL